ncbi:MAG: hypothetical protein K6F49_02180 [Saccharofermentans sp.]|nr:hypothetical protein [Saccharofermentans sp.]
MFKIRYLVSERDIIDWYKNKDDTLYGYLWFIINDTVVGEPPVEDFPMGFYYESLLWWQSQMTAVADLKSGEEKKCYFCTPNRLNLVFRNVDDQQYEITLLHDDKEEWRISIDSSSVLDAIEKFVSTFNNGIEYVVNNCIDD